MADDDEIDGLDIGDQDDVAVAPSETADPQSIIDAKIPADIRARYDLYSYRNAAVILTETRKSEFEEILQSLRDFSLTTRMIRTAGGNESEIPKIYSSKLRPMGWHETTIQADLIVKLSWKEEVGKDRAGKAVFEKKSSELKREKYLDGHKIDYVKNKVAFDLEWNSKDQTFDRDLYAFNTFFLSGAIDVGILVTRSASLDAVFRFIGPALKKDGTVEMTKDGQERPTHTKFGASTTWMGKLLYRLNAGRNGGCPVLAIGINPPCVSDWKPKQK